MIVLHLSFVLNPCRYKAYSIDCKNTHMHVLYHPHMGEKSNLINHKYHLQGKKTVTLVVAYSLPREHIKEASHSKKHGVGYSSLVTSRCHCVQRLALVAAGTTSLFRGEIRITRVFSFLPLANILKTYMSAFGKNAKITIVLTDVKYKIVQRQRRFYTIISAHYFFSLTLLFWVLNFQIWKMRSLWTNQVSQCFPTALSWIFTPLNGSMYSYIIRPNHIMYPHYCNFTVLAAFKTCKLSSFHHNPKRQCALEVLSFNPNTPIAAWGNYIIIIMGEWWPKG